MQEPSGALHLTKLYLQSRMLNTRYHVICSWLEKETTLINAGGRCYYVYGFGRIFRNTLYRRGVAQVCSTSPLSVTVGPHRRAHDIGQ